MKPVTYIIATTSRTGSSLLCSLLCGMKLGIPKEYYKPARVYFAWMKRKSREAYWQTLTRDCRINGVMGIKCNRLSWSRIVEERGASSEASVTHWIHLQRDDVIGQAISCVKARQSGAYATRLADYRHPLVQYNAGQISRTVAVIEKSQQWWADFLATVGGSVYPLTYERLCNDVHGELGRLSRFLGRHIDDIPHSIGDATGLRILRDDVTEQWRARFKSGAK